MCVLEFIHDMGKNSTLFANFCCAQFAMLCGQTNACMLKFVFSMGGFTFWPLVVVTGELFLEMNLACNQTFMKYPT